VKGFLKPKNLQHEERQKNIQNEKIIQKKLNKKWEKDELVHMPVYAREKGTSHIWILPSRHPLPGLSNSSCLISFGKQPQNGSAY